MSGYLRLSSSIVSFRGDSIALPFDAVKEVTATTFPRRRRRKVLRFTLDARRGNMVQYYALSAIATNRRRSIHHRRALEVLMENLSLPQFQVRRYCFYPI